MEALTAGWSDSSRRSSWCPRKEAGEGADDGRRRKGLARRGNVEGESREASIRGGREGGKGEAGGRRDSETSSVRREVTGGNQRIEIRPTEEGGKANSEKRQETNPDAVKKPTGWNQGDIVPDIITVGLTFKILRLKLKTL